MGFGYDWNILYWVILWSVVWLLSWVLYSWVIVLWFGIIDTWWSYYLLPQLDRKLFIYQVNRSWAKLPGSLAGHNNARTDGGRHFYFQYNLINSPPNLNQGSWIAAERKRNSDKSKWIQCQALGSGLIHSEF